MMSTSVMDTPVMTPAACLPHDLLWVAPGAIELVGPRPEWADAAWLRSAPVVVRREACADGRVPVGLRGLARNQRVKAYVPAGAVTRRMAPEALVAKAAAKAGAIAMTAAAIAVARADAAVNTDAAPAAAWDDSAFAAAGTATGMTGIVDIPAMAVLLAVAPVLNGIGLVWGPTGGVGFFLACGLPVLRPDSDLDVLVRAPEPLNQAQAAMLERIQAGAACRIDIQIDTGHGAFAFAEWLRGGRVMVKTGMGPQLVADPWAALEPA